MREIRCQADDGNGGTCNRFLARLHGSTLEIYCPRCKAWHRLDIVDLVRHLAIEANGRSDDVRLIL